nr:NACHT, LRR and PYD domains-containing protein 12-like [Chelonoidis abingdonii]
MYGVLESTPLHQILHWRGSEWVGGYSTERNSQVHLPRLSKGFCTWVVAASTSPRLRNCCISNSDCKQLASVVSTNQNLKELDLRGNNQGDVGVKLLCEGLKHPDCKLQKLVLSYCMLTAACCQGLSCVLSTNQTLRELDLEINKLGYLGVQQLCEGLKHATCKLEILRQFCTVH